MWPTKRRVSGARWPERAWKLIWACEDSSGSLKSNCGSIMRCSSCWSSSSSAMRRKNLEEHLFPQLNFSSQLKGSPFSRWIAISSGDRRLSGNGGGFEGEGNKGGVGVKLEAKG